jgi:HSP20 family protein
MNIFSRFGGGKNDEGEIIEVEETKKRPVVYDEEETGVGELSVDVYETPKEIIIEAMIAGVKPDDLHIATTHNSITISGKREANTHVKPDDYVVQELYWGAFSRTVELPNDIAVDQSEAVEKHGLLIVRLPKIDKERNVKVKVKSI